MGEESRIYCCESTRVEDLVGSNHVLCAGIDLNPALDAQGCDSTALAAELKQICVGQGGKALIPKDIKADLMRVARILNIAWIERGIDSEARLICSRGTSCPRENNCYEGQGTPLNEMRSSTAQRKVFGDF